MKKKLFIFVSIFVFLIVNLSATEVEDRSKNFESINVYRQNDKVYAKDILTPEETIETLKDVIYLLETSYIDFDVVEKQGFDKDAFIKNGEKKFGKENQIKTAEVYDYICKSFEPYVNDSHFNISYMDNWKQFICMKVIYLSDTYVEKTEKDYKIIKSSRIPLGTDLKLAEENLFKTILNGKEVYRLGVLESDYNNIVTKLSVFIDNKKVNLNCVYMPEYFSSNEFRFIETKNNVYINIPIMNIGNEHFHQFNECVEKCKKKKNIIIDLRQNPGGDDSYYFDFLYFLYYGKKEKSENILKDFNEYFESAKAKYINSPLIKQQYQIFYDYYKDNGLDTEPLEFLMNKPMGISYEESSQKNKRKEGQFKGNIIFLTSKNTASSAEDIIIHTKRIFDNVFIVGTNTMGCLKNANCCISKLKKSGIQIQTGSAQWINEFAIEEGVGFMPDYIVKGNLEDTIGFITKDKKIAKMILEINQ